ncbi:PepSY domain-containing protein [Corynebacterium pilosum]|uniref:Putative secreted protein n=1 Tax=Corynebacterium pilosum TaxID=35756 RepID=A0A376CLW7_9CORY|nr:PepSY domain-containing protein [Corynebacterium pilosum]STC69313.1 putative secreted protein [Corynebacterium pilosum]
MNINKKSFMAIAFTASTALALTACGTDADPQPSTATAEPGNEAVESASSTAAESAESEAADATTAEPTETAAAADGEDPVFAALDAVTAQYSDAIIVNVDREDDTDKYDVDAVIGNELVEFKVEAGTGNVIEEEREQNEDEVNQVANVNVSIEDAIQQALDQHPGAVVDEVDLEEENGQLEWQIDLDDTERNDLADVRIVAS